MIKFRQKGMQAISLLAAVLMLWPVLIYAQSAPGVAGNNVKEWEQLKYGMFIHFNMNTFAGAEYDNGKMPVESFNPSRLDVDQWIRTARDAGMKYAVLTAKHTGGFCLWDSKVKWKGKEYDYDIASSGYKKDIVAQFMESCSNYHIKPALYYCLWDDHNEPVSSKEEYFRLTRDHITELVTRYKGLTELWIDIPSRLTPVQRKELYSIVKKYQPDCLVTCNNGFTDGSVLSNFPADITNGERTLPPVTGHEPVREINGTKYYIPMEVCQTINQNWFWMPGDVTKSVRTLYYWYSETIKRRASFLLDVPPDLSGCIPETLVERLRELKVVIDDPGKMPPLQTLTGYKTVKASSLFDGRVEYLPEYAVDEDPNTRWLAQSSDTLPTLTVDLGAIERFNTVNITEPYSSHIQAFEIQYLVEGEWKTLFKGTSIDSKFTKQFAPVESSKVRMVITKFKTGENPFNVLSFPGSPPPVEGVTLSEFQVLNSDEDDPEYMNSFKPGREYFFPRSGQAKMISNAGLYKPRTIIVKYGNQTVEFYQTSSRFDYIGQRRESLYGGKELPQLKIRVSSSVFYLEQHTVLQHEIELSSSGKLDRDLTINFPVKALDSFINVVMPLKNGVIHLSDIANDNKIAGYRCAGKPEKYSNDLALPLIICLNGDGGTAVMTDPYFTSLYDRGNIRWTYPKEVGLEDSIEKRTIIEADGISDLDAAMSMYYQTILKDVPAGPGWMKDIAMISYDYMSDNGKGWYNDIDTLVKYIAPADRKKIALCLHGWYDSVGRYCFNEKTGTLDGTWTNRIRGIELTLADLHRRIAYAKEKGFRVLMYFADGVLSGKGLPDFNAGFVMEEGGWNGPDVIGGPYHKNIACESVSDFYRNYAKALFSEFAQQADGFVWDETFYVKAGNIGTDRYRGYVDRRQMRLVRELSAILHSFGQDKAFFTSDCIGEEEYFNDVPPYALLADGCYQDSHNRPSFWSYGIFPNYRNVIWSCNWTPLTNFRYTVFGVYAYNTPVVFTNGWGDDRGFSEMSADEKNKFITLFNYRKQFQTELKGLFSLPPYFEFGLKGE